MRALITGITGQDGSYLAQQLTDAGHEVFGLIHGQQNPRRTWLEDLIPGIRLLEGDLLDQTSLLDAIEQACPDEVYNLAAISAPALAWKQPVLAGEVTGLGLLRLLEATTRVVPGARVVQASSLAVHGPYGAAKLYAGAIAADFRGRGYPVSAAVFGGHHSPRRGPEFLSRKVTRAVAAIATGRSKEPLGLGNLARSQDWGWATDFVGALQLIARADPGEYSVSTGDPHTSQEWVETAFSVAGLDWREHVTLDTAFNQPLDVPALTAAPDSRLPWTPNRDFGGLVRSMVDADLKEASA